MSARPIARRPARRRRPAARPLAVEALEPRSLPSASWPYPGVPQVAPPGHDTLDQAFALGALSTPTVGPSLVHWYDQVSGTLGTAAANTNWFSFTLTVAADVTLTTPRDLAGANPAVAALTLYNSADVTGDDVYTPTGHRLLAQDDGAAHGGVATVEQHLAPGTYYVAVSGSGDLDFNPFLAGSGEAGATGNYALLITAAPLTNPVVGFGPAVVAATPGDGSAVSASPLAIRLALSSALDPASIQPGLNVVLNGPNAPPINAVFNAAANELQVFPQTPLLPGTYQLVLTGDDTGGVPALQGPDGAPLGSTVAGGSGHDYVLTFQVTGVDGVAGASASDDTISTAHDLGDLTASGAARVSGAIGVDPFASWAANQVDLYHFRVTGPGQYAFVAEADGGRIGSSLQPALALYEMVNGQPQLVSADGMGTGNQAVATDGSTPLANDAVVYAGLTAGDYYLAVGGFYNLPDPSLGLPPGTFGVFDPTQDGSAQNGFSVGPYLLNLSLHRDNVAPHVTEMDGLSSSDPAMPPTVITVHFDKAMNLRQLGYQQDLQGDLSTLSAIWVRGSDGVDYHPRLLSYDDATHVATFYLLDAVPAGPAALYLAGVLPDGSPGLTDLAGNLLAGSDANGDYVVPFTVGGPPRVIDATTQRLTWASQGGNTSFVRPQVIGPLFPDELGGASTGVDLLGHLTPHTVTGPGSDAVDYYQITLLQDRDYFFTLIDSRPGQAWSPTNARVRIFTPDGREITTNSGSPFIFDFPLKAGTYIVQVGPLATSRATGLSYRLTVSLGSSAESAIALTTGAAPPYSVGLQRGGSPAPSSPPGSPAPTPPSLSLPGTTGVVPAATTTTALAGEAVALSLPSGSVLGLSAPPVGGVRGTDAPQGPAVIAQLELPASPSAQAGVQLAALNSSAAADGIMGGDGSAAVIDHIYRVLDQMGKAAVLRVLHNGALAGLLSSWLRGLYVPPVPPAAAPPTGTEADPDPGAEEGGEEETSEAAPVTATAEPQPLEAADWLWASGLLAAGGLLVSPAAPERRRRAALARTLSQLRL